MVPNVTRARTHRIDGPTLAELRQSQGMSLRTLAAAAGISHSFLLKLEQGERGSVQAETAQALAAALLVPVTTIATEEAA
jgi:transcriptional regulator with XRE-family HTH domain